VQLAEHVRVHPFSEAAVRGRVLTPNEVGSAAHAQPVCSTYRIAAMDGAIVEPAPAATLVTLRRSRQQRTGEQPQRFRAPPIHIIHTRTTKPVATGHALNEMRS
jgi:hypothetical protein